MTTAQTAASTWTIDKTHSSVEFAVKHLMVSTVKGSFREFEAAIQLDEANPQRSAVSASVDVASIDTHVPDRDAHLRSDDFFNAEKYPKMTFVSKRLEPLGDNRYRVVGDLTIRDVSREVALDTEFEGRIVDPWGGERAAFTATATISRKEFNVRWNQAIETGGVVVGDDVRITLHVEAIRSA